MKLKRGFSQQAVDGLTDEGKVICVRLAVFAEMMKGREWTEAALVEVGGTAGIGVTFLEETFSARTSPPSHRLHQNAIRACATRVVAWFWNRHQRPNEVAAAVA